MLSGDISMNLIRKIINISCYMLKYRIFVRNISIVYAIDSAGYSPKYSADVRRVTVENVDDAGIFQADHYLQSFHEFLQRGDAGYYAYLDGKCAHRSWVPHNGVMDVDIFYHRPLKENEVFIHWCETADWARGHNLYPATLGQIIADNPGKRVCISVNEKNMASRRGVEKAGFTVQEKVKTMVVLGMKFTSIEDMNANVHGGGTSI